MQPVDQRLGGVLIYEGILNIWLRKVLIFMRHVINIITSYNLSAVTHPSASSAP